MWRGDACDNIRLAEASETSSRGRGVTACGLGFGLGCSDSGESWELGEARPKMEEMKVIREDRRRWCVRKTDGCNDEDDGDGVTVVDEDDIDELDDDERELDDDDRELDDDDNDDDDAGSERSMSFLSLLSFLSSLSFLLILS